MTGHTKFKTATYFNTQQRNKANMRAYAAFTPCRNYHSLELTTHEVLFRAVHVLGLGIMHFYGNTINT